MIRVIIIEDMEILRDSLANVLNAQQDISVVGSCDDAALALSMCQLHNPDIALIDICTANGSSGFDATIAIKKTYPSIKVVLFTGIPDVSFLTRAKEVGADSFVYKNINSLELASLLRSTYKGYNMFPQQEPTFKIADSSLSQRELEILRLVCNGNDRCEIAASLNLSENTIKTYIRNILAKTGFTSLSRLAIYAVSNGFITPDN